MTNSQGSGWYPDPSGRHQLRYFNTVWTDQVADNGVVSSSPLPPATPMGVVGQPMAQHAVLAYPPTQAPPPFTPPFTPPQGTSGAGTSRKTIGWIVGGVVIVGVVAGIAIAASGSNSHDDGGGAGGSGVSGISGRSGSVSLSAFCKDVTTVVGQVTDFALPGGEIVHGDPTSDDLSAIGHNIQVLIAEAAPGSPAARAPANYYTPGTVPENLAKAQHAMTQWTTANNSSSDSPGVDVQTYLANAQTLACT